MHDFVKTRVHGYYWKQDLNCATASLLIMGEYFDVAPAAQVLDSAIGMHGAGGHRAQCGLVEGTLMFIGIIGRARSIADRETISFCKLFAERFAEEFSSLQCSILRPGGFRQDDPPHLCEGLTVDAIVYSITLISDWLDAKAGEQSTV